MIPTSLILAAGINKRLWPISRSKALLEFAGRPIIDYVIADLAAAGLTDVIIVASPANERELRQLYPRAQVVVQPQPTGMAGGILAAKSLITGPVLILNASDLADPSLFTQVRETIAKAKPAVLLTAIKTPEFLPGGYFKVEGNKPIEIIEKPDLAHKPSDLFKAVVDYFADPRLLFSQLKGDYEQSLNQLIKTCESNLYIYTGRFNQLKYPWQILSLMERILTTRFKPDRAKDVSIHRSAVVEDKVILEAGVKVMPHATIAGPSYIGANTIIGNNALVRQAMIGRNCVIGYATEVARSWVGEGCWFHSNYIGDSVLEGEVLFGAGAVTANFRLDQQPIKDTGRVKLGAMIGSGTRVGVNTSLMPGIKVGSQAVIGPGLIVNQDLHDQRSLYRN